jgi:hypothetical protein
MSIDFTSQGRLQGGGGYQWLLQVGLEVAFVWWLWLPNVLVVGIEVLAKWLKFLPLVVRVGPEASWLGA